MTKQLGMNLPHDDEEIRAWEAACLDQLQAIVTRMTAGHSAPEILETKLQGEYPDTEIFVRHRRRSADAERVSAYRLWGPQFRAPRGVEPPSEVASLIYAWIFEGA